MKMLQGGVDKRIRGGVTHYNQPVGDTALIACPHCDLVQRLPDARAGRRRRAARAATRSCGAAARIRSTGRWRWRSRRRCSTSIANSVPMLGLTRRRPPGLHDRASAAPQQLWRDGREIVAGLVLFTAVDRAGAADRLHAGDRARRPARPRRRAGSATLLRHHPTTAHLEHDRGHDARRAGRAHQDRRAGHGASRVSRSSRSAALIFVLAAMQASFDPREVWDRVEWAADARRRRQRHRRREAAS